MSKKKNKAATKLVWFEIPVDEPKRAQKFWNGLFGWKVNPLPGRSDYWLMDTGAGPEGLNGGMIQRKHETQPITSYFAVATIAKGVAKVKKLGGTVCMPKTAVPGMGYFAVCRDTEGNEFALWEMNEKAR